LRFFFLLFEILHTEKDDFDEVRRQDLLIKNG
jgi:hypothetical protein